MSHFTKGQATGRKGRGFTLIELMIAIAVVAILVALAVPAYKDYAVRAKVAECIQGAAVPKLHISEYRQSLGAWPPSAETAAITLPAGDSLFCTGFTNYTPASGTFQINVDSALIGVGGNTIAPSMVPTELPSNMIAWDCQAGGTDTDAIKYLPSNCRDDS